MTVEKAIRTCLGLLAEVGVRNWNVCVVETFSEHPQRYGLCSYRQRMIFLSAVYLNDDKEMLETMRHEAAHVLSEGDITHGEAFQRALDLVPTQVTHDHEFRIELQP
jgi:hypothetical protein